MRDKDGLVDNELLDGLGCHQLRVPVVDDLVNDLVYEHEVLANALLVKDAAEVAEYLHHAVEDVHHIGRRHVLLSRRDEVYPELLCVEVVDAVHVLNFRVGEAYEAGRRVPLPEFDFAEEDLTGFTAKVQSDYKVSTLGLTISGDNGVASGRKNKEL